MSEVERILKCVFGLKNFRDNQEQVIGQILKNRDVFVVMPTGAGKSVCFQIPALILKGVTIVISPLISLMNEQVDRLQSLKINAIFLNRSLTTGQLKKAMKDVVLGLYKIVYVSPERLELAQFADFVKQIEVSLVVVDEAHCVLQWGFGFRPSYLKISSFFEKVQIRRPIFAAFTATVNLNSVKEISHLLKLKQPYVLVSGFLRPNLFFNVFEVEEHFKIKFLVNLLKKLKYEITIIYCQTRRNVDFLFQILLKKGFNVQKYHAGLSREARRRSQELFLKDEVNILIATNAFGMGIDKKDVRNVIHYNMPKNLEDYYQEAGRAGRDGEFSRCFMMYSYQDVKINRFIINKMKYSSEFNKEKINEFRQRHYNKLHDIVKYCESSDCYVKQILNYFGDRFEAKNCHFCGNCQRNFIDITDIVIKVLNVLENFKDECSCNVVLKILKGRIFIKKKFKRSQNYGKLKKTSIKRIKTCLMELKKQKYITENLEGNLNLENIAVNFLKNNDRFYLKNI